MISSEVILTTSAVTPRTWPQTMVNSLVELSGSVVRSILFTRTRPGSLILARWGGDEAPIAEGS